MKEVIHVTGMVLRTMPIGEYDKRLTILTREHGKITAFARGAKKPNSALLACTQPFVFGDFTLREGLHTYAVHAATIEAYFTELREDLDRIYYGLYFCELADYFTQEEADESETLKLLYLSLRALGKGRIEQPLIRVIYELRLYALQGIGPRTGSCVCCGATEALTGFSAEAGGILCETCAKERRLRMGTTVISATEATLYALRFIAATPLNRLFSFTVSEQVLQELTRMTQACRSLQLDYPLRSEKMLTETQFLHNFMSK